MWMVASPGMSSALSSPAIRLPAVVVQCLQSAVHNVTVDAGQELPGVLAVGEQETVLAAQQRSLLLGRAVDLGSVHKRRHHAAYL